MVAWSQLFDDDEELGDLLEQILRRGRVDRHAALAMRRRAAALAALTGSNGQGPQGKKSRLSPFSWKDHMARLSPADFKRRYRLSWPSFKELLGLLKDDLEFWTLW